MTSIIKLDKCMSIKNKNNVNIQCPYNKRTGSDYCGIHCRSKKVRRIDNFDKIKTKIISTSNEKIEQNTSLYMSSNMLINFSKIRKTNLINTLMYFKLIKTKKVKLSKRQLYIQLHNYLSNIEKYNIYLTQIITIQKYYRRYSICMRSKSVNECDLLTLETINLIPIKYYIKIMCKGNIFSFDLRYLYKLFQCNANQINPYTQLEFTSNQVEQIKNRFNNIRDTTSLLLEAQKLTVEQQLELNIISVFKKYNDLDNYTNPEWFSKLNLSKLKNLYIIAEDVWNYRAQLSESKKLKILKNSKAFTIKVENIKKFNNNDYHKLREIIIDIFDRFVSEGIDVSEKKLGSMLMLTALVEISIDAANAMPFLIQVS